MFNDPWGSHLHVIKPILEAFAWIENVLDHGMGNHSTACFLGCQNVKSLISLDSDPEWVDKCRTDDPRHQCFLVGDQKPSPPYVPQQDVYLYESKWIFEHPDLSWDLALVDGYDRMNSANILMERRQSKIVLVHDYERSSISYRWDLLRIPEGWDEFRYDKHFPETGVFAEASLIEEIRVLV